MYGPFHITFALAGSAVAVISAKLLSRLSKRALFRILAVCGIAMAASEVWKQIFYFYVVYGGRYNWWYFPFQLCSVPMYLCMSIPILKERGRRTVCTFLWSYTLLGAVFALAYPQDMFKSYLSLTLHSFTWHVLLVFISFLCFFGGLCGKRWKDFFHATALFLALAGVATVINAIGERFTIISGTYPNMFYISPYHLNDQPGFREASKAIGILPSIAIYLAGIIIIAAAIHAVGMKIKEAP